MDSRRRPYALTGRAASSLPGQATAVFTPNNSSCFAADSNSSPTNLTSCPSKVNASSPGFASQSLALNS